ncbi:translocase of chloroplast 34, chloroplastic-like [Actinia tenebrosa]|uniref:Translocase of chloroplast 34, chloroplastic-like n=1 Tax=Actinia tenebrosa TaxID=6105 RepID=A0A6P8IW88_ACTTE|nr:translocase of chloroplast 34, chloroplastic-like [Actinia tenebrosa]
MAVNAVNLAFISLELLSFETAHLPSLRHDNQCSSTDIQDVVVEFKKWFFDDCPQTLNLLITGKTGVGKSRLVNALVGKKVAKEGRALDPCTSEVTSYKVVIKGVAVTVWDSPGLQDGTSNEDQYIEDMKKKIKDVALIIYCVRMDDTRFYDEDKKAIRILTEEFGKDLWVNAVVALTFANKVEDPDEENDLENFRFQFREWKKQLKDYFAAVGLNPETSRLIPIIPVGNKVKSMRLPDRENWLSALWIECCLILKLCPVSLIGFCYTCDRGFYCPKWRQ